MSNADTIRGFELLDISADTGGCGCGGCGCGSTDTSRPDTNMEKSQTSAGQVTQRFAVTGLTCGHCASAVTSELTALDGVTDVRVDLVVGGTSTVTVSSQVPLEESKVIAALDEAGAYQLV